MSLTHPSGLHTNPAFSQGVRIDGGNLGQNGTDSIGDVVPNDLASRPRRRSATSSPCSPRQAPTNAT
jgi:hypothetical protein